MSEDAHLNGVWRLLAQGVTIEEAAETLNTDYNTLYNYIEKEKSELQAEGITKTFAELDSFENKVKAFAYEASKGKEKQDDGIMKFAGQGKVQTKAELTADDIFNKYL